MTFATLAASVLLGFQLVRRDLMRAAADEPLPPLERMWIVANSPVLHRGRAPGASTLATAHMNSTQVWYIVSDVHLDTRRADPRGVRHAFARFVDDLAEQAALGNRQLVLLGDLFDLGGEPHDPVARLVDLAHQNRDVFRALGAAIDSGLRVHVVCGNQT